MKKHPHRYFFFNMPNARTKRFQNAVGEIFLSGDCWNLDPDERLPYDPGDLTSILGCCLISYGLLPLLFFIVIVGIKFGRAKGIHASWRPSYCLETPAPLCANGAGIPYRKNKWSDWKNNDQCLLKRWVYNGGEYAPMHPCCDQSTPEPESPGNKTISYLHNCIAHCNSLNISTTGPFLDTECAREVADTCCVLGKTERIEIVKFAALIALLTLICLVALLFFCRYLTECMRKSDALPRLSYNVNEATPLLGGGKITINNLQGDSKTVILNKMDLTHAELDGMLKDLFGIKSNEIISLNLVENPNRLDNMLWNTTNNGFFTFCNNDKFTLLWTAPEMRRGLKIHTSLFKCGIILADDRTPNHDTTSNGSFTVPDSYSLNV